MESHNRNLDTINIPFICYLIDENYKYVLYILFCCIYLHYIVCEDFGIQHMAISWKNPTICSQAP